MSLVCRVCLAGNTGLHSLENNLLINLYEKLSNTKSSSEDARPRVLCYICHQKLLRCHTFSQMACRSEKIISYLLHRGLEPTHDNITEADRRMQQHLSTGTVQFGTIDDDSTDAGYQLTIKDEPLYNYDIEEKMTAEQNNLREVPENCTKSLLTLDINQIHQDNQVTIKYEPIPSIGVKEKDKLQEVESVHEDCFKSELTFEEDNSNRRNDVVEDLLNINCQETKPDVSKMRFGCNDCHILFFQKNDLISHIRSKHSEDKRNIYRHLKTYSMKSSMNEDIDNRKNQHSCNVCDKQFSNKDKLVVHMRIHTGQKPFACNVCDKQFRQICTLVEHMKIHTSENLFICHVCNKQFNQKGILIEHMTVHTGEKPFACGVCDKRFRRKCDMVTHTRIHTGENLFTCHVCDKQFNKKCHIVDHMLFHTGEKPFTCSACGKRFRRKCDSDRHKKIHTGEKAFACNVCDKQFNRKFDLERHTIIHTGEKPFACNVCDKQFNRKFELERHTIIHTGETPFACNVCDKQFNLKCNLMRHMRIHTA